MINLMYIVLTAMLALNVSSDVLDAFAQVEDGLTRTNRTTSRRNDAIFAQLEAINADNPAKAAVWFRRACEVRGEAERLSALIDSLRHDIAVEADGSDADVDDIRNRESLESASVVMLNPVTNRGAYLRSRIDAFSNYVGGIVTDSIKRQSIKAALSTEPYKRF